jgi:hypothetical protein
MATGKITGPIGRTIRAAKKQGLGGADIATRVRERHGIDLDRRSIDRWLKANPVTPPRKRSPPGEDSSAEAKPAPLDELETLEERAIEIKRRLDESGLGVIALATLNRELRQTFASIRKAKESSTKSAHVENSDARWMIEKLRRFAAMNGGGEPAETDGVPEAARAAGG